SMRNELLIETEQHVVPPPHGAGLVYHVHKRLVRLGIRVPTSSDRLFNSHDRLLNDPAQRPSRKFTTTAAGAPALRSCRMNRPMGDPRMSTLRQTDGSIWLLLAVLWVCTCALLPSTCTRTGIR